MSTFKEVSMIISILTRGWIIRIFTILLWSVGAGLVFTADETKMTVALILIATTNGVFYMQVTSRLQQLVDSDMALIIPNYFAHIKKSLAVILLVSFIPTLVLLPNIEQWLGLLTVLLIIAILAVAMSYQPQLYWGLAILFIMPVSMDMFKEAFDGFNFKLILACLLPFAIYLTYTLLNKLETYKGNKKHIERMKALSNFSPNELSLSQKHLPFNTRNKVWQWLINKNFSHYRDMINSKINTNHKLIEISCQDLDTVGRFTYIIWFTLIVAVIVISHLATYFDFIPQGVFHVLAIIFPATMLAGGTITTFQTINSKRKLLNRLSTMPCFTKEQSFPKAFARYFIISQVKLYAFIVIMVGVLAYSFEFISIKMYMNVVLMAIAVCIINLTIMFTAWQNKPIIGVGAMWLMVILFLGANLSLIYIKDQAILLLDSPFFITLMAVSLVSLALRVYTRPKHLFKAE